jgi:hypothetical protein
MSLIACISGITQKIALELLLQLSYKTQLHLAIPVSLLVETYWTDAGIVGCSYDYELNRSINPKRQFLGCFTTAFSERYFPLAERGGAVG